MGAIHGQGYYDRIGLGEACLSGARGRCRGSDGSAQAASACTGSGVLQSTAALSGWPGGVRNGALLGAGVAGALRAALLAAEGKSIVLLAIDFDPVARGYVASLSRPGGSVTGIFVRQLELAAKRVEIAREAFPRATVLGIAFDTISREQRDAAAEAAGKLGLEPRMIEVKGQQDYGGAFNAMDDARGQPIILPASPMFFRDREAIAQALLERRIPSITAFRENMEAGALISYGFDLMGLFYDMAAYVHRIAGGATPFDTPI